MRPALSSDPGAADSLVNFPLEQALRDPLRRAEIFDRLIQAERECRVSDGADARMTMLLQSIQLARGILMEVFPAPLPTQTKEKTI